jgi:hypothetical protein
VEKAAMRWSRVALSVVPAWPIEKATNSTRPQYLLRAEMRSKYFSFFIDRKSGVASEVFAESDLDDDGGAWLLIKESWVGRGESGTPLVYIKSDAVPCPLENRSCVSAIGRNHVGMQ